MKIRETLQRRNHDVKQDLDQIVALVSRTQIPVELEPYRIAFLARTRLLLNSCRENLALLLTGEDSLLADVLSETSTLVQYTRLLKFRYLRGLYRAMDWDRVCLRTITWLHKERSEEHTSELQSRLHLVCRLLLEKKKPPYTQPPLVASRRVGLGPAAPVPPRRQSSLPGARRPPHRRTLILAFCAAWLVRRSGRRA